MRNIIKAVAGWLDINDLLVVAGLAALFYGLMQILPAFAFIAVGLVLLIIGLVGAWRKVV